MSGNAGGINQDFNAMGSNTGQAIDQAYQNFGNPTYNPFNNSYSKPQVNPQDIMNRFKGGMPFPQHQQPQLMGAQTQAMGNKNFNPLQAGWAAAPTQQAQPTQAMPKGNARK